MSTLSSIISVLQKRLLFGLGLGICLLLSAPSAFTETLKAERFKTEQLGTNAFGTFTKSFNNKGQICWDEYLPTFPVLTHAYRKNINTGLTEDLGTLPGDTGSQCSAINDLGQVVGISYINVSSSEARSRAFVYTDGVGMTDLSAAYCGSNTSCKIEPVDINNNGQVIGHEIRVINNQVVHRAFRFGIKDGSKEYFGIQADVDSTVKAINDAGQTLVSFSGGTKGYRSARFTDGKGLENLGKNIRLSAINSKGQVAGTIEDGGFTDPAIYTDGKGWKRLRPLKEHITSFPLYLSDSGIVFGRGDSLGPFRGFSRLELLSGYLDPDNGIFWTNPECPEKLVFPYEPTPLIGGSAIRYHGLNNDGQLLLNLHHDGINDLLRMTPVGTPVCGALQPNEWRTVKPVNCNGNRCKNTIANYRTILRKKATNAIKAQRASDKAKLALESASPERLNMAKVEAAKRKAIAAKALEQFDKAAMRLKRLSNSRLSL